MISQISPYLRDAELRWCGLHYRSTEHLSSEEGDSGSGEEGEGNGSRDLEKEGGGPRAEEERVCLATESGRGRVR
jgi:hypothetical protein